MKSQDWLHSVINTGNMCGNYTNKVNNAMSKKQMIDICLDSNGIEFLQKMQAKGMPLPYETLNKEFGSYINGKYIAEYKNDKGKGYTSSMFCCYTDSDTICIETTLCAFLGCKSKVVINENDFVHIYADKNCDLIVFCPKSSKCIIDYWKGAKIEIADNYSNVLLTENV
jgi:hypothetical protein